MSSVIAAFIGAIITTPLCLIGLEKGGILGWFAGITTGAALTVIVIGTLMMGHVL